MLTAAATPETGCADRDLDVAPEARCLDRGDVTPGGRRSAALRPECRTLFPGRACLNSRNLTIMVRYTSTMNVGGLLPEQCGPLVVAPVWQLSLAMDPRVSTQIKTACHRLDIPS